MNTNALGGVLKWLRLEGNRFSPISDSPFQTTLGVSPTQGCSIQLTAQTSLQSEWKQNPFLTSQVRECQGFLLYQTHLLSWTSNLEDWWKIATGKNHNPNSRADLMRGCLSSMQARLHVLLTHAQFSFLSCKPNLDSHITVSSLRVWS